MKTFEKDNLTFEFFNIKNESFNIVITDNSNNIVYNDVDVKLKTVLTSSIFAAFNGEKYFECEIEKSKSKIELIIKVLYPNIKPIVEKITIKNKEDRDFTIAFSNILNKLAYKMYNKKKSLFT